MGAMMAVRGRGAMAQAAQHDRAAAYDRAA
jgi:hypothetical protein